jgi:hypothetical protein
VSDFEPHEADGVPVLTVVGNDGVRWACRVCNQTVFQRGGRFLHFDKSLNLEPVSEPEDEVDEFDTGCTDECGEDCMADHRGEE